MNELGRFKFYFGFASSALLVTACSQKYDFGVSADPLALKDKVTKEVICDPLSGGGGPSAGLRNGLFGSIYHSPPETQRDLVEKVIRYGTKSDSPIFMGQVNVPPRAFDSGFPGANGNLKDNFGNTLMEYFALSLNTNLIPGGSFNASKYQLGVLSDDGSLIYKRLPDGSLRVILNNDRLQSPKFACASEAVEFVDGKAPIRLNYSQGPKYTIAFVLFWRPWQEGNTDCVSPSYNYADNTSADAATRSQIFQNWKTNLPANSKWEIVPSSNFQLDADVPDNTCQ